MERKKRRGQLNLNLLPSSNMGLSFIGDDGHTDRLAVLSHDCDSPDVVIEEIYADASGRSFLLNLLGPRMLYFWCSEKSKSHGLELLDKMKDLLRRKPSLSCLTGISESCLDSFATHLLGCSSSVEVIQLPPVPVKLNVSLHVQFVDTHYVSTCRKGSFFMPRQS